MSRRHEMSNKHTGWVYMVAAGPFTKIGMTQQRVEDRAKQIDSGLPVPASLVHCWKTTDPRKLESCLHYILRSYRTRLEWFKLPDTLVAALVALDNADALITPDGQAMLELFRAIVYSESEQPTEAHTNG